MLGDFGYACENYIADDLKTVRADLVQRVLWRMPVRNIVRRVKINDVHDRNFAVFEWEMVVFNSPGLFCDENILVADPRGSGPNNFREPGSGVIFAFETQLLPADEVGKDKCFHVR